MIKVGLCDDIMEYNKKIASYIEEYGKENHIKVKIKSYMSGSQLLLNYQKRKFDIIFLDVSMPGMNGFETAERIRCIDKDVSIVSCTAYYTISNASKGFEVEAEDFLAKPLLYKKIQKVLDKVYRKKLLKAEEKLFLKCQDGVIAVQLSDLIYVETKNKTLVLHTMDGNVEINRKIGELEKRLSNKLFYRCHNSYMVNMDYVEGIESNSVLINNEIHQIEYIPISKYRKEDFLKRLADYMGKW